MSPCWTWMPASCTVTCPLHTRDLWAEQGSFSKALAGMAFKRQCQHEKRLLDQTDSSRRKRKTAPTVPCRSLFRQPTSGHAHPQQISSFRQQNLWGLSTGVRVPPGKPGYAERHQADVVMMLKVQHRGDQERAKIKAGWRKSIPIQNGQCH
eukprot:1767235-Pleurochrysis_carterae.AAC.1